MKLKAFALRRRFCALPEPAIGFNGYRLALRPLFSVSVESHGQTVILTVDGEVDTHTSPVVDRAIKMALGRRPRRLVVDLSQVRFLDSAGLRVLLAGHYGAGSDTDLRIVANTRATWRPLRITGLHETLTIHASRVGAVAARRWGKRRPRRVRGESASGRQPDRTAAVVNPDPHTSVTPSVVTTIIDSAQYTLRASADKPNTAIERWEVDGCQVCERAGSAESPSVSLHPVESISP